MRYRPQGIGARMGPVGRQRLPLPLRCCLFVDSFELPGHCHAFVQERTGGSLQTLVIQGYEKFA
jgi:hypothetical protein